MFSNASAMGGTVATHAARAAGVTQLTGWLKPTAGKTDGLREHAEHLASADSPWLRVARLQGLRLPECTHRARYCNNCLTWAIVWRERIMARLREPRQQGLVLAATTAGTAPSRPHRAPRPAVAATGEQLGLAL